MQPKTSVAIAACVLATLCTPATVRADEVEREAVYLDYVAEGRCPARARIVAEVGRHAENWQLAEAGARARRFVLRIERRDAQYVGRLDLHSPSGEVSAGSEIRGPDCEDVALGLSLAVALALDPRSTASRQGSPPPTRAEPEPPAPERAPPPRRPSTRAPPVAAPSEEAPRGSLVPEAGLGARIEGSRGIAKTLAGAALFGELAWTTPVRWLMPKLRLGARRTLPAVFSVSGGHVDVTLSAAFAELCPVAFALGSRAEAGACVQGSVGSLSAAASNIPAARDEARIWLDYGGLGTFRWWLARHMSVEACLGFSVPITRHRIRVESSAVVTRADAVVLLGSAGVVYRF